MELACSLAWCVQPTGGVKGEVGIGPCRAGLASVRAIVGLGGDWVARLPSWWWVGLVVTISLGSVKGGGVGVEFGCGQ